MKGALATNISHGVRHREVREPDGWDPASTMFLVTGRRRRLSGRPGAIFRCGVVSRPPAGVDVQEERDTMQRGRYLSFAALVGALALAAAAVCSAPPPPSTPPPALPSQDLTD